MGIYLNSSAEAGLSDSRVWAQFPWEWRMASKKTCEIPLFNGIAYRGDYAHTGDALLEKALDTAESVRIVATGPNAFYEAVTNVLELSSSDGPKTDG